MWEDWGVRDAPALTDLGRLVVERDGVRVGSMSWHPVFYGPNLGSRAYNIGISLREDYRGQGIGSIAQRLLVEHLFATTDVLRIEASTDVDNVAEQRGPGEGRLRARGHPAHGPVPRRRLARPRRLLHPPHRPRAPAVVGRRRFFTR